MAVTKIRAPDFDLEKTLKSGQVFHWVAEDGGFCGLIGDLPVSVRQEKSTLIAKLGLASPGHRNLSEGGQDASATISQYFSLDHPLADICQSFPRDPVMDAAADYCRGLRIIRQPKWECLATFICSSMKQVAHIRQISHALRRKFGEPRQIGERTLYVFPTAHCISEVSELELRKCALGYRAKNFLLTAKKVASGEANIDEWSQLPDLELKRHLCDLPGVGLKVANCVMLFAYERLRAFPIDVWIERVLRERYFVRKRKPTTARLREFSAEYFGEHGGYAQQYLFHHARTSLPRGRPSESGRSASPKTMVRVERRSRSQ